MDNGDINVEVLIVRNLWYIEAVGFVVFLELVEGWGIFDRLMGCD